MGAGSQALRYVATVPRGLGDLLLRELAGLGIVDARERGASVAFGGGLDAGYRACLHSRVASRVLLEIAAFDAASAEDFYAAARAIDWRAHVDPDHTIACDFSGQHREEPTRS